MRFQRILLIFLLTALILPVGATIADNNNQGLQNQNDIRQNQRKLNNTRTVFEQLSRNIDLWHDANLKGNSKKIHQLEQQILVQIQADIALAEQAVKRYETEVPRFKPEPKLTANTSANRGSDFRDYQDAKQRLQAKKQLADAVARATTFSHRYRLLENYLEILRTELGITRPELVGDNDKLFDDLVEGRRE
jgi:exonuclease VII large subunit